MRVTTLRPRWIKACLYGRVSMGTHRCAAPAAAALGCSRGKPSPDAVWGRRRGVAQTRPLRRLVDRLISRTGEQSSSMTVVRRGLSAAAAPAGLQLLLWKLPAPATHTSHSSRHALYKLCDPQPEGLQHPSCESTVSLDAVKYVGVSSGNTHSTQLQQALPAGPALRKGGREALNEASSQGACLCASARPCMCVHVCKILLAWTLRAS